MPKRFFDRYPLEKIPLPVEPVVPAENIPGFVNEEKRVPDATLRQYRQAYFAAISYMDELVGQVLAERTRLKLADNTLILFSSDNGPENIRIRNAGHSGVGSAGPFRGRKRSLYEGGIRVPGIVRWPGKVPAGKIDDTAVVAGVDWLPTLARLANTPVPANHKLDGEDMSDVLMGKTRARSTPLFWEWRLRVIGEPFHQSPMLAMREGDWKLLMNPDHSRVELYEITKDLTQLSNVAAKHPQIVARLSERLLAWQQELPPGPRDENAGKVTYALPGMKAPPAGEDAAPKKSVPKKNAKKTE